MKNWYYYQMITLENTQRLVTFVLSATEIQLNIMIKFLTSHLPFLQRYRRKKLHKIYIYDRICETHNKGVRVWNSVDPTSSIEIQRTRKRKGESMPYYRCRISESDLNVLQTLKRYKSLNEKYKKRLTLLEF